jgi:hypothetical protein
MHLFGNADEPNLTHFIADRQGGSVVLACAQGQEGVWHGQVKAKVKPTERLHHPAHGPAAGSDHEDCGEVKRQGALASLLLLSNVYAPPMPIR